MFALDPQFVRPAYDARCFTALPSSVAGLLSPEGPPVALSPDLFGGGRLPARYRRVVVFLIDGFGWRFFEKYAGGYPALRRFVAEGAVVKGKSQFPSTTAAHVTCLHTGLEVGQSGVYEWQYYEPQLDAIIVPLLFSFAGTRDRDQLRAAGVDPRRLMPTRTLYHGLGELGIRSHVFQHKEFTPSTFSDIAFAGARATGYRTLPEALVNLRAAIADAGGPSYFVLYFGNLDTMAHEYGPNSPQFEAEVDAFLTSLDRLFLAGLRSDDRDLLVLLTADHGFSETDPATTLYVNLDPAFAGLRRFLANDRAGRPLVPAGSPRDFFLHVRRDAIDEAHGFLARRLAGLAAVYRTRDLIDAGFFGAQPPSPAFLSRVGNLVILPYLGKSVWWYEKDRFEQRYYGHHGGLTPQEMEIPLLALAP